MIVMPVRAAGYVIVRKIAGYEYLLLQASYPDFHWSPPKGHVDPGEDEPTAALREVEEESGLKKEDLLIHEGFEKILEYKAHGKPKSVVYWLAELKDSEKPVILSEEHKDLKWLPCSEAGDLAKFVETKELFNACEEFLQGKK